MKLTNVTIYRNHTDPALEGVFSNIIMQDKPLFFGRLGGIEYLSTMYYYNNPTYYDNESDYQYILSILERNAGYFDFDTPNKKKNLLSYLAQNLKAYENYDYMFYAGIPLIPQINAGDISSDYHRFLQHLVNGKTIICYGFMEDSWPFLHSFKEWGEGKKILIVSPFEKSLKYQNDRRDKILINYAFPNFELVTYKSSVTYSSSGDTKESLGVTTNSWHEELDKMKREISLLDFDIALLSCACYTAPLGDFIAHTMGKKAIYVGGILNMLFNIFGGRYVSYAGVRNMDYQIHAFENEEMQRLKTRIDTNYDGLNAYFG